MNQMHGCISCREPGCSKYSCTICHPSEHKHFQIKKDPLRVASKELVKGLFGYTKEDVEEAKLTTAWKIYSWMRKRNKARGNRIKEGYTMKDFKRIFLGLQEK